MSADIIVSYDGTPNDDDALALGKALTAGGATLALAYVRHSREFDPLREELAEHDAQRRVRAGAEVLGDPSVPTHVIVSASTDGGLEQLAAAEGAKVIVFGSDYRTPPGHAEPGNTAQRLLEGGPVAIAVAQAGLRTRIGEPIRTIGVPPPAADGTTTSAANALVETLGAEIVTPAGQAVDLLVVGSSADATPGRVNLSGSVRSELNSARGSVLVLPQGTNVLL
jgi:nucleotide-binding universal stress UspA family protein